MATRSTAPMSEPWLSILMPVYNVAPYLRHCVDSIFAQGETGIELILLDDVSTDGSGALMRSLSAPPGITLRCLAHDRNRGPGAARNNLVDAATGRFIWFLDSDDWLGAVVLPQLRQIVDRAAAPDIVFVDYRTVRARHRLKHRLRGEQHRRSFVGPRPDLSGGGPALLRGALASSNLFSWGNVCRRSLWDSDLRFPEGRTFEDMATTPRLMLRAASAAHIDRPCVMYRRRDGSLSATLSADKVADLSRALLGFRQEMLATWPDASKPTRLAVAHQCARNLVAAVRHARRLGPAEAATLIPRCRADFFASVGEDLRLLWRYYLLNGRWARAWALWRALGAWAAPG
jgi:glycosyltransferase involved in cell wall biosynthesis